MEKNGEISFRREAVSYTHLDVYKRQPYKKANRKFHPDDSVIDVEGVKIGGGSFAVKMCIRDSR